MRGRSLVLMVAALMACASTSCQPSPSSGSSNLGATDAPGRNPGPAENWRGSARDLSSDEIAGGHVLRKHVGRTDDELRERLEHEHNIFAASTYTDRDTAQHAVGAAIALSQDRIQRWLNRAGGRPNLVLDYDSRQTLGRTLSRGDSQSRPCSHAVIVLKYSAPSYYVLTSYPECRS